MTLERRRALLVEDSRFFGSFVRSRLSADLGMDVTWARSLAEAQNAIAQAEDPFGIAVCDLVLPDASDGQVVDLAQDHGLPVIVLTSTLDDSARDAIWSKNVVDYVLKEGPHAVDYVVDLVRRLDRNDQVEVLVVDDSAVARRHLGALLRVHRYQVHEAVDGESALRILAENPKVRLMLVDYNMPGMDGFELAKKVRKDFPREEMAIIGVSDRGSGHLSARFIKSGANDFLNKPFVVEEFYCRVTENMRALEQLRALNEMATADFLTGLANRRHFFLTGEKLYANALRKNMHVGLAMIDIDHFKLVNDAHGHQTGDEVLRAVATVLGNRFRASDLVARLGGEEFAVMICAMDLASAPRIFDEVRHAIEELEVVVGDETIRTTVSVGLCMREMPSLDALLNAADDLLYQAKQGGRNRVMADMGEHYGDERVQSKTA